MELPYGILSQLMLLIAGGITVVGGVALVAAFLGMGRQGSRED